MNKLYVRSSPAGSAPAGLGSLSAATPPPFLSGRIFTKVVLEAPLITESALEVIRKYCEDEVRTGGTSPSAPST